MKLPLFRRECHRPDAHANVEVRDKVNNPYIRENRNPDRHRASDARQGIEFSPMTAQLTVPLMLPYPAGQSVRVVRGFLSSTFKVNSN
jgi:hypothetical protein